MDFINPTDCLTEYEITMWKSGSDGASLMQSASQTKLICVTSSSTRESAYCILQPSAMIVSMLEPLRSTPLQILYPVSKLYPPYCVALASSQPPPFKRERRLCAISIYTAPPLFIQRNLPCLHPSYRTAITACSFRLRILLLDQVYHLLVWLYMN
jgi:hypothetical protein